MSRLYTCRLRIGHSAIDESALQLLVNTHALLAVVESVDLVELKLTIGQSGNGGECECTGGESASDDGMGRNER